MPVLDSNGCGRMHRTCLRGKCILDGKAKPSTSKITCWVDKQFRVSSLHLEPVVNNFRIVGMWKPSLFTTCETWWSKVSSNTSISSAARGKRLRESFEEGVVLAEPSRFGAGHPSIAGSDRGDHLGEKCCRAAFTLWELETDLRSVWEYIYTYVYVIYIYYTYIDNIFIVELETRHQVFWKCPLGERVATRIPQQNEPRSVCKSKGFQMRFSKPFNYKPYQFFSGTKTPVSFFLGVFNEETN